VIKLPIALKNDVTSSDTFLERLCASIRPVHALKQDGVLEQIHTCTWYFLERITPVAGHSPTPSLPSTFLSPAQLPIPRPSSYLPPPILCPQPSPSRTGA
jgi:hypothetical protein